MKTIVAFVAGAGIGAAIAYYFTKQKCEAEKQEEIDELREYYGKKRAQEETKETFVVEGSKTDSPIDEKPDLMSYAKKLAEEGYTNYGQHSESVEKKEPTGERPYVISPDEFGEMEDYNKISLMYYADGVLCDDMDVPVDNIDEIVGADFASHFGEYEDDSVFVRNDPRKCDYEILRSLRTYGEIIAENPYKAEV